MIEFDVGSFAQKKVPCSCLVSGFEDGMHSMQRVIDESYF